ncbi:nuclear cap-binding protein subunit 2 [Rhizopus delemar RA 99-880]|uniref:Nuclear cap-binding protein subunit 2 n=1 Tax=Rhizopus delemar (strain RA 99-880 / ATCC MYA-4621 / FGSC 9543 / NRRL 43880) TaxID=246409 RepID=I1BUE6_RHIO9|nr:nuclear cap-binding protein subunit 2 [Rhizopus delemar RA 99-880]|eukprot:EIE79826.1 nuclear cap-binding protein subunit 2 [Rhizopus delemar RA 99-880]
MTTIINSLATPSSYRDQLYQMTFLQQQHFTLAICHSLQQKNKYTNFLASVEKLNVLSWDLIETKKHLVDSVLWNERIIRCDLDPGFKEGRQFGRGKSGGQVRDEYRTEYDAGRGGWGHRMRMELERNREKDIKENYEAIKEIPKGADEYVSRGSNMQGSSSKRKEMDDDSEQESRKRHKEHNPRFRENDDEDEE